jgi:hypothetical protein
MDFSESAWTGSKNYIETGLVFVQDRSMVRCRVEINHEWVTGYRVQRT